MCPKWQLDGTKITNFLWHGRFLTQLLRNSKICFIFTSFYVIHSWPASIACRYLNNTFAYSNTIGSFQTVLCINSLPCTKRRCDSVRRVELHESQTVWRQKSSASGEGSVYYSSWYSESNRQGLNFISIVYISQLLCHLSYRFMWVFAKALFLSAFVRHCRGECFAFAALS